MCESDEQNVCLACHKQYASRTLAVRHLMKAKFCLPDIVRCIPPLPRDISDELDHVDISVHKARCRPAKNAVVRSRACRRLPGPLRRFDEEDTLIEQLHHDDPMTQ